MADLSDRFDAAQLEKEIYQRWQDAHAFEADASRSSRNGGDRTPFTIVMPPPNVTAILHVGHGLNNTIQDVIIRWARMRGAEALWVPGTDHAGIATQNVVEKMIAARDRQTRFDIGRETFVKITEEFVEETGGTILAQLKSIGASADWRRTAYTLSPELSHAVRTAFVRLYEKGLIYKGHRVIHWCPRCLTSLSDEEAEFNDEPGFLYHIRYGSAGGRESGSQEVVIATTRPETMLADVAVAVNPADERYRDLIGKTVVLPILDIEIPVIADEYADPAFGTGVVKITPAHDANDFEVGKRHKLAMPIVIDETGVMREVENAGGRVPSPIAGMDRFQARDHIVAMLKASGALVRAQAHEHAVRHCYRCDTVVEPRLSDQWFVKMEPLARPALQAVRDGAIRVLPERWEAVYIQWLENIRDWNISRQLWWGHRIPVYYCVECDPPTKINVSVEPLTSCPHCGCDVVQDEDVLDTWFSSWLWPISTLGWPNEKSPDLKAFYPTDVLITAPEILFFWVARMIMSGYEFMGRAPFHTVYLHGTVRDTNHMKMSKSLGNGIDPLEVVNLYGADALRWTVVAGLGMGADVILDPKDLDKSFATGRNFATKLWNIGRFILGAVGDDTVKSLDSIDAASLTRADRWILARLDDAIAECDAALGPTAPTTPAPGTADERIWRPDERFAGLRLSEYAEASRRFVWNELADWYVETAKGRLTTPGADRDVARAVLVHCFDQALRLLHPIVPFVTEALWQKLPSRPANALLATSAWPRAGAEGRVAGAREFDVVQEMILAIRQIRATYNVTPGKQIEVHVRATSAAGGAQERVIADESAIIGRMARATVQVGGNGDAGAAAHAIVAGCEVSVPLAGLVDVAKECERLRAELSDLDRQIESRSARLDNEKYVAKAPPNVVANDRQILADMQDKARQLREKVASLCG
ncbi:MAG TPA: valine--tRNA ligase [Gemmatimonadaceae bacterium]|nr:valine--tRNA ligase [Gemmatimonadaceae bacterium]